MNTADFRRRSTVGLFGLVGALTVTVLTGRGAETVAPLVVALILLAAFHRVLFRWESLIAALILVVMLIPMTRYRIGAALPFNLEPYRVLVTFVIGGWLTSLLIDPRVTWKRTPFDAPLGLLVGAVLASTVANPDRTSSLGSDVAKEVALLAGFVLIFFFMANVLTSRRMLDRALKLLVASGALVAVSSLVERRWGYNIFFDLRSVIPFLQFGGVEFDVTRGGRLRVFGSAQHPIALGALFAMLVPIGLSLAHRFGWRWWVATASLTLGVLATASRTPIVMLMAVTVVLLAMKPRAVKQLVPLAVPAVVVVHFILPGAIGTLYGAFFPKGGIIAEQATLGQNENPELAGGRIRLIKPSLAEWSQRPVLGQGFGTRITGFRDERRNAPILDNQWLATLLEIGVVGVAAWVWLFVRSTRRMLRAARQSTTEDDEWFFLGLAAAIPSFAVGLLTYDGFSFIQVTVVFWMLLGIAAASLSPRLVTELKEERLAATQRLAHASG